MDKTNTVGASFQLFTQHLVYYSIYKANFSPEFFYFFKTLTLIVNLLIIGIVFGIDNLVALQIIDNRTMVILVLDLRLFLTSDLIWSLVGLQTLTFVLSLLWSSFEFLKRLFSRKSVKLDSCLCFKMIGVVSSINNLFFTKFLMLLFLLTQFNGVVIGTLTLVGFYLNFGVYVGKVVIRCSRTEFISPDSCISILKVTHLFLVAEVKDLLHLILLWLKLHNLNDIFFFGASLNLIFVTEILMIGDHAFTRNADNYRHFLMTFAEMVVMGVSIAQTLFNNPFRFDILLIVVPLLISSVYVFYSFYQRQSVSRFFKSVSIEDQCLTIWRLVSNLSFVKMNKVAENKNYVLREESKATLSIIINDHIESCSRVDCRMKEEFTRQMGLDRQLERFIQTFFDELPSEEVTDNILVIRCKFEICYFKNYLRSMIQIIEIFDRSSRFETRTQIKFLMQDVKVLEFVSKLYLKKSIEETIDMSKYFNSDSDYWRYREIAIRIIELVEQIFILYQTKVIDYQRILDLTINLQDTKHSYFQFLLNSKISNKIIKLHLDLSSKILLPLKSQMDYIDQVLKNELENYGQLKLYYLKVGTHNNELGKIMDSSKNIGELLGVQSDNLNNNYSLNSFLPNYLSKHHDTYIRNSLSSSDLKIMNNVTDLILRNEAGILFKVDVRVTRVMDITNRGIFYFSKISVPCKSGDIVIIKSDGRILGQSLFFDQLFKKHQMFSNSKYYIQDFILSFQKLMNRVKSLSPLKEEEVKEMKEQIETYNKIYSNTRQLFSFILKNQFLYQKPKASELKEATSLMEIDNNKKVNFERVMTTIKIVSDVLIFRKTFLLVLNVSKIRQREVKILNSRTKKYRADYIFTISILKIYMRIRFKRASSSVLKYQDFKESTNSLPDVSKRLNLHAAVNVFMHSAKVIRDRPANKRKSKIYSVSEVFKKSDYIPSFFNYFVYSLGVIVFILVVLCIIYYLIRISNRDEFASNVSVVINIYQMFNENLIKYVVMRTLQSSSNSQMLSSLATFFDTHTVKNAIDRVSKMFAYKYIFNSDSFDFNLLNMSYLNSFIDKTIATNIVDFSLMILNTEDVMGSKSLYDFGLIERYLTTAVQSNRDRVLNDSFNSLVSYNNKVIGLFTVASLSIAALIILLFILFQVMVLRYINKMIKFGELVLPSKKLISEIEMLKKVFNFDSKQKVQVIKNKEMGKSIEFNTSRPLGFSWSFLLLFIVVTVGSYSMYILIDYLSFNSLTDNITQIMSLFSSQDLNTLYYTFLSVNLVTNKSLISLVQSDFLAAIEKELRSLKNISTLDSSIVSIFKFYNDNLCSMNVLEKIPGCIELFNGVLNNSYNVQLSFIRHKVPSWLSLTTTDSTDTILSYLFIIEHICDLRSNEVMSMIQANTGIYFDGISKSLILTLVLSILVFVITTSLQSLQIRKCLGSIYKVVILLKPKIISNSTVLRNFVEETNKD